MSTFLVKMCGVTHPPKGDAQIVLLHLVILQCTCRMTQVSDSASSGTVRESEFELFLSNCHRLTLCDVPKSPADRFCFVG